MVRSDRRRLIMALGGLWLVGAGVAAAHVGRATPELQGQSMHSYRQAVYRPQASETTITVQWVFRQGDLLSCRTSVRDLRHALLTYGDQVRFSAVAVDTDPEFVRDFLRAERLDTDIVVVSEREYREELGSVPTPSVLVLRAGNPDQLFTAGNLRLPNRPGTSELAGALGRLLAGTAPTSTSGSSRSVLPSPSHP